MIWTDVNATNKTPPVEWYFEGDVKLDGVGPTEAFYAAYFDAKSGKVSVLRRQEPGQQGLSLAERAESLRRDATSSRP